MSIQDEFAAVLKLPPDDYFAVDDQKICALQDALTTVVGATEPSEPVLVMGGPPLIDRAWYKTVPVLVGSHQTGLRTWQVNPRTNLHVFLRDLTTGALMVADPLLWNRRGEAEPPSGTGTPPDELNATVTYTAVEWVDLADDLDPAPIHAGRYTATVTLHEVVSNSLSLQVEGGPVRPPRTWLAPRADAAGPAVLNAGVDVRIEIPATPAAGAPILARVARRVGVDSGVVTVKEAGDAAVETIRWYWTCNIVLLKLDQRPIIVPVVVPVAPVTGEVPPTRFDAGFELDLSAVVEEPLSGDYQIYLDVGERFLGPFPLRVTR